MYGRENFLNRFKLVTEKYPESISVYCVVEFEKSFAITYRELDRVSGELSGHFSKIFQEDTKYIGVSLRDCFFLPCLILGIWKSGFSFAGAANQYKRENTLNYLNFLNVKYLITDTNDKYNGEVITQFYIHHQKFFVLFRNTLNERVDRGIDICYGIMTSGSTGQPKIIEVPWLCILPNAVELSEEFQIKQSDCVFQASPYTFDPFFIEFFMTVINGCCLKIVSNAIKLSSSNLLQVLFFPSDACSDYHDSANTAREYYFSVNLIQAKKPNMTVLQITPSFFKRWTDSEIKKILSPQSKLRILILGGEKFPVEILKLKHPDNITRIFNIYGITEISCWAFLNDVTGSHPHEISLGKPLKDIQYKILENGEFLMGSKTRFCLINGETDIKTEEVIYRDSGDIVEIVNEKIYYVGRSNQLVKKYGIKIDLNKIEEAYLRKNKLKDCCCVFDEGSLKLGLFYVPVEAKNAKINYTVVPFGDFSNKGYQLPKDDLNDNEVPDYLIELKEVPINSHGKCNRRKLLQYLVDISKSQKSGDDLVNIFKRTWLEVLRLEKDNLLPLGFIELGGNSVLALEMVNKLEDFGVVVPQNFVSELLRGGNYESCLKCLSDALENAETPRKKLKMDEDGFNENDINLSVRWKFDLEKCVDATPAVFLCQGNERVVVGSHSSKLSCLDFDSGQEIWSVRLGDRIESAVRVNETGTRGFVGCYDYSVYCVDLSDGSFIWRFKTGDMVKSTPCLSSNGKVVYVASYDKHLYCLSVIDGQVIKKLKLSDGGIYSTGTVSDSLNAFCIGTLDGTCAVLDQEANEIKWKKKLNSPVFASPCFISEKSQVLFSEVLGVVHCFDAADGTSMWVYQTNGNLYSSPITQPADKVNIIFGCHDHHLYCLQYDETPELKWKLQLDSSVFAKPSTAFLQLDSRWLVCAATTKGFIYICDFISGVVKARLKLKGDVFSSIINYKSELIVGCRDNNVYALNISRCVNTQAH